MEIEIKGCRVVYRLAGAGKQILLLHGWGVDSTSMTQLFDHLRQNCQVALPDLPGFGQSTPPQTAWSVYDYADFVAEFCQAIGFERPVLLGHSFGGRLALILGARGLAERLILCDAAGLRPKRGFDYYLRVYSYKAAKQLFRLPFLRNHRERALTLWRKNNPSGDYQQAEGVMRAVFVRVVNEDLGYLLPQIAVPTLLLWGELDTATPLADGQRMEREIADAGLVVFNGAGHYPFLEQPGRFYLILDAFLREAGGES